MKQLKCNAEYTAQKMKFSIQDFFRKCDQIRSFLRIWSDLLQKSLMENFIFCAVVLFVLYVFWFGGLVSVTCSRLRELTLVVFFT